MEYEVLDVFKVGENTSVTVAGNGQGLKNGITLITLDGRCFKLLAVGLMVAGNVEEMKGSTTILIEGEFSAHTFRVL